MTLTNEVTKLKRERRTNPLRAKAQKAAASNGRADGQKDWRHVNEDVNAIARRDETVASPTGAKLFSSSSVARSLESCVFMLRASRTEHES